MVGRILKVQKHTAPTIRKQGEIDAYSLSLLIQSNIPARKQCHPQPVTLPTSMNTIKIVPKEVPRDPSSK